MNRHLQRLLGAAVVALLTFVGLVATTSESQALDGASFKPGLIISDTVFFDYGTMSAAKIQKFLEDRVAVCTDGDGGPKCIRNYTEKVVGSAAIRANLHDFNLHLCDPVPASDVPIAASLIIYQVAVACKINPQVLLVTLQKEQGLITAADPTTYMYKAAMGYGCPDSAPQICGKDSNPTSRLFWQLYRASWQFKYYGHPSGTIKYYKPGVTHNIYYSPKTSCGKSPVFIESQATSNLYYYTPYQPNAAALRNLGGSGDGCSAYGNRNFWRYFWTWFGNPTSGVNLIRSSASSDSPIYLVNLEANVRYLLPDDAALNDYKVLGSVGEHSRTFVNSFTDGGSVGSLVADKTGIHYLVSAGMKYKISSAAQATALGLNWVGAPVLTGPQLSKFSNMAFAKSPSTGRVYLLQGGTKAEVVEASLQKTLSILGPTAPVKDSILNGFTDAPAVTDLVQDSSGVRYDIQDDQKILIPNENLATAIGRQWSTATTISTSALNKITTASFIKDAKSANKYFLSEGTKHLSNKEMSSAMAKFGSTAQVSTDYLNRFTTGTPLGSLLKSSTDTWYITGDQRFKVTMAQATNLGAQYSNAVLASSAQLATIPAPIVMKSTKNGTQYLVDDYVARYPLASTELANYSGLGPVGLVPKIYLNSFAAKTDPGRFVNCTDGYHYYLVGAKRYRVADPATAKAIAPTIFTETDVYGSLPTLTPTELVNYAVGSTTGYVTTYTKSASEGYYIENGVRHEVLDAASLGSVITSAPAVSALAPSNFNTLPLGRPYVAANSIFKNSTTGKYGIYAGNTYYPMSTDFYDAVKTSSAWRFTKSSGTLSAASVKKLTQGTSLAPLGLYAGTGYVLGAAGKQVITDIQNVVANAAAIPAAIFSRIDSTSAGSLTTPFVVSAAATAAPSYLLANGVKRVALDAEEATAMLPMASNSNLQIWPQSAIDSIVAGTTVSAPGSVVKVKESGNYYLIDGWAKGLHLTASQLKAFTTGSAKIVTKAQMAGYKTTSSLDWQKVICASNKYLVDAGALIQIDTDAVAQWPGVGTLLDSKTCQRLPLNSSHVGNLIGNGAIKYLVSDKKLRQIRTIDEYNLLSTGHTPAVSVSSSLIAELPKGNPTSYVVVAKDTMYSIAIKFKTTKKALRNLNHLHTNVIRVGQVLNIP